MDHRFLHHNHLQQPPQQQPQQQRTRYALPPQSHHHHHLPPPPTPAPPPPPPLSYRTIHTPPPPPPPPYNPPLPQQFPIYPHREEERPLSSSSNHHHSFSNRNDLLPRRILPEPPWNPNAEDRPIRNYPPRESPHHHHHRPPPLPPPSHPPIRYDQDNSYRELKTERLDGNPREGFVYDGGYHRRPPNQASWDVPESKSGGYGRVVYGGGCDADVSTRVGRVETRRFVSDRKGPREFHDSSSTCLEFVNDEIGVPLKREYHSSEMVRYSNSNNSGNNSNNFRGNNGHGFSRNSPKKQIQKKSALLRIQTVKPNHHRNRDVDQQLRYAVPDSNNNFFRGKDQHGYLSSHAHVIKAEEEREGSPVELDISFESNSLVAKAIVAAPSTSGAALPVSVSNADYAGSQLAKPSSGGENLVDDEDNKLQKNVGDTYSQPCASENGNPHEAAVSVKGRGVCFDKSSKVVKKKRIVKRVVKKGSVSSKSNSTTSSSLPLTNAVGGTMQADCVALSSSFTAACDPVISETCLEEKSTDVDKVSVQDCSRSLPNEGNVLGENKKGGLSVQSSGPTCKSQECKTDEDSDFGKFSRFERSGSISNSPSRAPNSEDKNGGSHCLDACNSVHDLLSLTSIDNVTKSLNGSTSETNHTDCENMQLCQNEVSLSLGKYTDVGCSKNRNPVDETVNESRNIDTVGKAYCENMEENSDTAIPLQSSGVVFSSLGNTRIQDGQDCLQNTSLLKQGSDNGSSNSEDSIILHDFGIMNNVVKASSSEVTIFPENCNTDKAFPNSNISVGSDESDTHKIKKRKVRTYLSLSSSNMDDISPDHVYPVSHENDSDRGSSQLLKDPCLLEVLNHSLQRLDFDSQSTLDRDTALHGRWGVLETEFYVGNNDNDDADKVSPVSKKKKVTSSLPISSHCQSELSDAIVATTSSVEVQLPISLSDNKAHQDDDVTLSSMGTLSNQQSVPYSGDIAKLPDSILTGGSFESTDANREAMSSERLKLQHSDIVSTGDIAKLSDSILTGGSFESMVANRETVCSQHLELQHSDMVSTPCEDLDFPNVQIPELGFEQQENSIPNVPVSNTETDILGIGNIKGRKTDSQAVENSYHYRDVVQRSPSADIDSNDLIMKNDSFAEKNRMSCPTDGDGVTTSNSNDEVIEDSSDALSDMCSQGMASELLDRTIIKFTAIHDENMCGPEENPNNTSIIKHGSDLHTFTSSTQHTEKTMKSDYAIGCSDPTLWNIMPEPSQVNSKLTTRGLKSHCSELNGSEIQPGGVILKNSRGHSFAFPKSKTKTSASSILTSKSRTWHRTGNNNPPTLQIIKPSAGTIPPKRPILERNEKLQNTSYIRKGNSLVRKPTPVSAKPQISSTNHLPFGLDEIPKSTRSESRADVTDQPIYLKKTVSNAPQQRQSTPPLPIDTKSDENISSLLVEPLSSNFYENASDLRKFNENNDAPDSCVDVRKQYETPENQTCPSNIGESQVEANEGNILSLNSKRIVYMKPKTNQLVATSNSCDVIVSADDRGLTAFSDGYYKRSKNQLVRTTLESHINPIAAMPNSIVKSDGQGTSKMLCNRRFTKRRSHKVLPKSSRASLVWTLRSKNSSGNDKDSWHYQKVLPPLFPWKRATYLRSFIHNSASSFNSGSLSTVSKNLLLLRKRDTVYTRSTRGFSLWKSKVLGVGGSSLKWSKSIEKHSKKANEEATLAVAAVERKKREQKDPACIGSQAKRERIFRIGSVRYRMDPSRRTLQRISDDESLSSASISSGLAAKRAYIPRRLVIGNDEYVRIGNGNQLIRDPKKRTRKLANEKVRWSLHTARQRLARKQKYCQFFTRFGKCNKDGGKCPYIHDPSKIAVCTKFLHGLCSTPNCKLTHKVIPERMQDCSYFLQGLCSNGNCPYRHVNVNPKASICEGFLKGYCADGNECRKKHSYVCPSFEATGTCAQGTKCKLHHPKKQSKGKKRKRSDEQNNSCRGRYFGSVPVDVSEPGMMVAPRHQQQNEEPENELTDYISLNVNEEDADTVDQSFDLSTFCDNDTLDLDLDTSDELIKPVLIITKFSSQSQCSFK